MLADAVRVASGVSERGHADDTRLRAAEVHAHEPDGASDRGVRPPTGAEDAGATVDVERPAHRTVEDGSGLGEFVVADTPWRSNASSHTASTPAMTTGRYSGLHPA